MNYFKPTYKATITAKTDLEIIRLYKESSDTNLVGELYNRYHHIVFGVALKYLQDAEKAEDALLEVFNHLFEQLLKYKIDEFKSWLLTVTRNHCLKIIKSDARVIPFEPVHENLFPIDFMENETGLDLMYKREKQIELLEEALKKLKPEQNQCIRMFYLEDKSYQDIAEHTGYALKKVKSYIQNGKRNLQLIMEQMPKK
jgi:RNA polymerase sigma-70 factor (ECF subfamily)